MIITMIFGLAKTFFTLESINYMDSRTTDVPIRIAASPDEIAIR